MITFVRGILVEKQPSRAVLDVGGVGYEVLIPISSFDRLPRVGEECLIHTVDHVREDAHLLFGFMTLDEREMFGLLCGISGIGPKLALGALSGLTVRELKAAVVEGDVKRLSSISGIGKKSAERIIVELRHKISQADALEAAAGGGESEKNHLRDAVLALVALGYKQEQARDMVAKATKARPEVEDVKELIRLALAK